MISKDDKIDWIFPDALKSTLATIFNKYAVTVIYPDLPHDNAEKKNRSFLFESDLVSDDEDLDDSGSQQSSNSGQHKSIAMVFSEDLGWHLVEEEKKPMKEPEKKEVSTAMDPITSLRSSILSIFVALFKSYRECVNIPPDKDIQTEKISIDQFFNKKQFMETTEPSCQVEFMFQFNSNIFENFIRGFIQTQIFSYFLQQRLLNQEDDIFDKRVSKSLALQKQRDGITLTFIESNFCSGILLENKNRRVNV